MHMNKIRLRPIENLFQKTDEVPTILCDVFSSSAKEYNTQDVKNKIKDITKSKQDDWKKGFFGELISHFVLLSEGYEVHNTILNLESQNDNKKGFDGVYTFKSTVYFMESKSGTDINHLDKIREATYDLNDKINNQENCWVNALNHLYSKNFNKGNLEQISSLEQFLKQCQENVDKEKINYICCSTNYQKDELNVFLNKEELEKINTPNIKVVVTNNYILESDFDE